LSDLIYYTMLKEEARRRTMNAVNKRVLKSGDMRSWDKTTLCSIGGQEVGNALEFAEIEWPKHYGPHTHNGFTESWTKLNYRYSPRKNHFDLAIWQEVEGSQVLVALALGNPSSGGTHLTVKWVERFYGHNYLAGRALWPILTCAEEYAKLLGCQRVLIKDPVDITKYERYGYAEYRHPNVAHGGDYLAKELNDER
jgi:hypothetical protein